MARGFARLAGDLVVVCGVGEQSPQGFDPWGDILGGHFGYRHHALIEARLIARDGVHGQQIRHAHLGFGQSARVGRHHGDAAKHRFDHYSRAGFGPERRDEKHSGAREEGVDVVDRIEDGYVGTRGERGTIRGIGSPGRDGGEANFGERVGERKEDRDTLHGAWIDHGDEFVIEAAEIGPGLARHERDGHVNGVDAGVTANVIGGVLADADDGIGLAEARGLGFVGEGAIGSEGKRQRGAHQINNARTGGEGGFEKELRGIVGGAEDDVGVKGGGLCNERGPQLGVGGCADVDAFDLEIGRAASDDAALVAARGESFHEQPIGFFAAAVGGMVDSVLREQDFKAGAQICKVLLEGGGIQGLNEAQRGLARCA